MAGWNVCRSVVEYEIRVMVGQVVEGPIDVCKDFLLSWEVLNRGVLTGSLWLKDSK